jgi:hypothetical protein
LNNDSSTLPAKGSSILAEENQQHYTQKMIAIYCQQKGSTLPVENQ